MLLRQLHPLLMGLLTAEVAAWSLNLTEALAAYCVQNGVKEVPCQPVVVLVHHEDRLDHSAS